MNRPEHYGGPDNPYEPIKIIDACGWLEGFCLGNTLKYTMRAGNKEGADYYEDLEKARTYLSFLIDGLGPGKETHPLRAFSQSPEARKLAEECEKQLRGAGLPPGLGFISPERRYNYPEGEVEWEGAMDFSDYEEPPHT